MKELLKNKKLVLQHVPGKGAWTYHLVIPDTKDIRGKWGVMKVSGTIDGHEIKDLNLAPLTGKDKRISINSKIRKAIGKKGGDEVIVTLYKTTDNHLTQEDDVKDCFKDADVYQKFKTLPDDEQEAMIKDILAAHDESKQEKMINKYIDHLSAKK
ncbi:uncharacterized protein DUF1905 [Arcticibacter pallidicorallinus]|uniref:Uncharacterized protein DUF1905 n=1 Tax=Arcticibacter pallidicorallinus TaxID=1259464 RepID=A0A2T0UC31_9SPHI|nr:DUF1905 domain-containing protein [Arcticibacter pallidicorallinus]PRY55496.1 uncharacterized protein DUF1905 [Arcticibacter pallidicorallinus]